MAVQHCSAESYGTVGFHAAGPAKFVNCSALLNDIGIEVSEGSIVEGCRAIENTTAGISHQGYGMARRCNIARVNGPSRMSMWCHQF